MSEKTDIFDSYMKLSNFFSSRHDRRREYEWKISFGFWALIAGAILKKPKLPVLREHPWAAVVSIILGVVFALTWIRGLYIANEKDKYASFFYSDKAKELFPDPSQYSENIIDKWVKSWKSPGCKFWLAFIFKWSSLFHVIVTATLIAVFNLVDS